MKYIDYPSHPEIDLTKAPKAMSAPPSFGEDGKDPKGGVSFGTDGEDAKHGVSFGTDGEDPKSKPATFGVEG